jgi:hypothetical protein
MHYSKLTLLTLSALIWVVNIPPAMTAEPDTAGPVAVVQAFNAAVTAREIDAALATLAEGSVQIQLRAMHPGMSDNPPLTGDLRKTWQMVGTILFPASESYDRLVEITGATANGDVATVWTNTSTRTVRKGGTAPTDMLFTEVYLLVYKQGRWQIAAIADNRAGSKIAEMSATAGGQ